MIDFMTTKQAAELWSISQRRVSILCEQGRIDGVKKAGIMWLIPPDTKKPEDARTKAARLEKEVK
jgi:hypothetical protein